jgi:hypothetical protein
MGYAFRDEEAAKNAIIDALDDLNIWGLNELIQYAEQLVAMQAVKFDKPKSKKIAEANICEYEGCTNEMIGFESRFNYTFCAEHEAIPPYKYKKKKKAKESAMIGGDDK